MWLFTTDGVYSIVQKGGRRGQLCVRARDGADLDRLRSSYLPKLGPTITDEGTDYPFRAYASRAQVARAAADAVKAIHYGNFKDEVKRRGGAATRLDVFHRVWAALLSLEPVGAWRKRWDDWDDWDDEPLWAGSFMDEVETIDCRTCGEPLPLLRGEDVSDPEERERIAAEIQSECEYNDTGFHCGQSLEEALAA